MKRRLAYCLLIVGAGLLAPAAHAIEWIQDVSLFTAVHGEPILLVDVWVEGDVEVTKVVAWDTGGQLTITVKPRMWATSGSCVGSYANIPPGDTGNVIVNAVGATAEAASPQSDFPCGVRRGFKGHSLGRWFPVAGAPGYPDKILLTDCACPCD